MLCMHKSARESRQMHSDVIAYVTLLVLDLRKRSNRIMLEYFPEYCTSQVHYSIT
jgi:hypothetical protein